MGFGDLFKKRTMPKTTEEINSYNQNIQNRQIIRQRDAEAKAAKKAIYSKNPTLARQASNLFVGTAKKAPSGFFGVLDSVANSRIRRIQYVRSLRRPLIGASKRYRTSGGRGRPRGSYDLRYAKYGGVYGYRKMLNAQLRQQRLETMRRNVVNPQQQAILDQMEARERARQTNLENQTIADTRGEVRLRSIHDEINDAANAVP
jgi:hypothetical protein